MSTKLSVGIPVLNGWDGLKEAIYSVLKQIDVDVEIIVSDNCSDEFSADDFGREFGGHPSIKYIRQTLRLSAAENFKFVLDASSGDYFMWLAGDDFITPNFLNICRAELDSHPDVVGVTIYRCRGVNNEQIKLGFVGMERETHDARADELWACLPDHNGRFYSVFRRSKIEFDTLEFSKLSGDFAFMFKMLLYGKVRVINNESEGLLRGRFGNSSKRFFILEYISWRNFLLPNFYLLSYSRHAPRRRRFKYCINLVINYFGFWMRIFVNR